MPTDDDAAPAGADERAKSTDSSEFLNQRQRLSVACAFHL
jgi:hypothetical protein